MEPKVNYLIVGLFVVVLGITLVGVVLWLAKGDYQSHDRYYAFVRESVAGLSLNAPVKYHGVEVGSVTEIVLNPDNPEEVRLTLDILRGTPVKEDTIAIQHVQGLTGFAIIDLTGGTRTSPRLTAKPGEPYPVIKTGPSFFARLNQEGSRLMTNLNQVTEDVQTLIDESNRAALRQILTDMAKLTNTLAAHSERLDQGVTNAAETAQHLATMSKDLSQQLPIIMKRIDRSALALQGMTEEVTRASSAVGDMVKETRPNIEAFSRQTLAETGFLIAELRELTASLQRVARQLEREPSALIFGGTPPPPGPGE